MKIACLQIDTVWENKTENFSKVEKLTREAAAQECALVCLPELFSTGFTMNSERFAEEIPGNTTHFLEELAEKHRIYIIGSLIEKRRNNQRPKNSCVVYNKEGRQIAKYNKIHLFSYDEEDKHYSQGSSIPIFSIGHIKASMFICYDLRFPELFIEASVRGAKIIFVPANWPSTRLEHWQTLLKARAIENQIYIVGVNRTGRSPTLDYPGSSMIVGPFGGIVAQGSKREEIVVGEIQEEEVDRIRTSFPFFKDRKTGLSDFRRD